MSNLPLRPLRLAVLLAAALAPLRAAAPGEATVQVDVLRAEAAGDLLDVMLRVEVHGEDPAPLGPDDFAAYIAPVELPAEKAEQPKFRVSRIFLKRLRGAYYLDLRRLPPGSGARQCQLILRVSRHGKPLGTGRVARLLAARSDTLDVVLVIDESLSMLRTDPKLRRIEAAKTFVDLAYRSSRIARVGIVAFNQEARTLVPLTSLANIDALHKAIDRIAAWGQTDMDGSLDLARSLLERGDAPTAKAVVLLTDGKDEPGRYEGAHARFARRRWRVFTVGLSERADHDVLRRIARDTGGAYHDAPTSAQLQDIFGRICLTLQKQVAIRSRRIELPAGEARREPFPVDETISSMTVRLQAAADDIGFALRNPADRTLEGGAADLPRRVAYARKGGHQYFNISRPWPGQWTADLSSPQAAEADLAMSAATPLLLRAFPLKATYYRGEPVELAVSLASLDAVLDDARVEAHVTDAAGRTETLPLHDDGQHGDRRSADGVFAAVYRGSDEPGTLGIRLVASGTSPGGHRFERELSLSVPVRPEEPSKLWAAAAGLDFGVVYNGQTVGRDVGVKLTSKAREPALETVQADIELPVADGEDGRQIKLLPRELHLDPQPLTLEPGQLQRVRLTLTIPAQQPEGRYRGTLRLTSRTDKVAVPVTLEVRHPRLILGAESLDLGRVEPGDTAKGAVALHLEPRGTLAVRLNGSSPHLRLPAEALAVGPEPISAKVTLAPPKDAAAGTFSAKLVATTPLGRSELPIRAQIVRPSLAVTPRAIDFGQVRPGETAEAPLALELDGLKPQSAEFASEPLAAEGAPPLRLDLPDGPVELSPEKPTKVTLRFRVPPVQPPGTYRGSVTIETTLGKQSVPAVARVPAAATFRVETPLDLGRVAIGSAKEGSVEIESLVDSPQTIRVALPEPSEGRHLSATPAELKLPAGGRAELSLRLSAAEGATPGQVEETVQLRGPSQDARVDVRAALFRPPHQSLAFEPAELEVGYLLPTPSAEFTVSVRPVVGEEQALAIEGVESESKAVQVSAELAETRLAAEGSAPLAVTVAPQVEPQRVTPFEATVHVRGRSEPTSLRVRGVLLPPPGRTLTVAPSSLDFGSMRPGENSTRSLELRSLFRLEQDVRFQAESPQAGLSLTAWPAELALPANAAVPVDIGLTVTEDAEPGARRITGHISGPGESAEFEVTVEVVSPALPPMVAAEEPLGWQEWLVLLALILALLLALLLLYLYIRWLLRSRAPRPVKVFTACLALSGLLHALLLSSSVDIFWRQGEPDRPGVGIKVALRNIAGSVFSSRRPSVADELSGGRESESERQVKAERRQGEGSKLSRKQAEAELLQKEKLQALVELAGAVCHEMNQPMQVTLVDLAECMMMREFESGPARRKLEKIRQQLNSLREMSRKLMHIARYETRDYVKGEKIIDLDKSSQRVR